MYTTFSKPKRLALVTDERFPLFHHALGQATILCQAPFHQYGADLVSKAEAEILAHGFEEDIELLVQHGERETAGF